MSLPPHLKKVLRDLTANKIRTLLVVLSIAIGVFAVGQISTSYIILLNDLEADYQSVNPHSAILYTSEFDQDQIVALSKVEGVGELEGRRTMTAQVRLPDNNKGTIFIASIPDPKQMQIDRLRSRNGVWDLPDLPERKIWLEQGVLAVYPGIKAGDRLTIMMPDDHERSLEVAAIIHDVGAFPYIFSNMVYAYITPQTMEWLGGSRNYNQVNLTTAKDRYIETHVQEVARSVANRMEKSGRQVYATQIFKPGEHPVESMMRVVMAMLGGMGFLALFLSGFLVVNTISALLGQQTRQIGVMKAIGGETSRLVSMYFLLVVSFGILALLLALPFSTLAGYAFSSWLAVGFNFNLGPLRLPFASFVLQVLVAIIVPLIAGAVPVFNGTRLTVREALSSYGLSRGSFGTGWFDHVIATFRGLPRPMLLSLRNTFRRKGRLTLTLSTLTLGGAIFLSVFNVRDSIWIEIDKTLGYFLSDLNISLDRPRRISEVEPILMSVPEITRVEAWGISNGEVLTSDKNIGTQVIIWAPPSGSQLIRPTLRTGRWLVADDENAVVIGNHLLVKRPELGVGDKIILKINKKEFAYNIVGLYVMAGNVEPPFIYVNREYLAHQLNQVGIVSSLRAVTSQSDADTQNRAVATITDLFKSSGIRTGDITTGSRVRAQQAASIDILIAALLVMAVLIAAVGGLGLMGTMSMNVMERTREIGVIRSYGATDLAIFQVILVEGMVIGILSWLLGAILSVPMSILLGQVVGVPLLSVGLKFVFSLQGFVIWFFVVIILSAVSSLLPARSAARLTIREVLAYE